MKRTRIPNGVCARNEKALVKNFDGLSAAQGQAYHEMK